MTVALLALLYLLLSFSLDAAGWTNKMGILIPVVLGAVTMGALMAFSRFDGFFMLSHSLSTGLAWVFYLMTRIVGDEPRVTVFIEHGVPELQARSYFLLERWLEWVEVALSGSASNDNYVFILEISFLIWWLAYLGVWTVLRHGHVWRGVILAGIAILVNTYYAPQSVVGLLVSFCITAMILLVWTNMVSHRQRWRFQRIRFNQDIGFDFMRNGVIYAIVVILLAFITPNLGRNVQFHQWLDPINQRWEATTSEWNRLYQGINRQSIPVQQAAFGRSLTLGGERNVSERPVLQVSASQGRYWRAVTFDTFTGRQWLNTATDEVEYDANQPIPTIDWDSRRPITQTITLLAPGGNILLGAPDIRLASVPIAGLLTPVFAADEEVTPELAELTWSRSQVNLDEGSSYTVVSNYTDVTIRAMREAEMEYPPQILEKYLQLPENFSPRVAALAVEVAENESTVYDKARAVERFLRSNYQYNEEISAPASDQDPVEYFLFEIEQGYCDYYATAMAVMLRSLGIPARTASGYAEGTYDRESGVYIITERDAHTWVEVYFPGYGWIEFEPTAGESVLNRPSGLDPVNSENFSDPTQNYAQNEQPMIDDFFNEQFNRFDEFEPGFFEEAQTTARDNWIWISVGLTLVALLGGGWLLRRRLYQGPDSFEAESPNLFYARLLNWVQRLGMATQTGETPYERAAVLSQQIPTGTPFIRRITDIYVLHRFAPRRLLGNHDAVQSELAQNWQLLQPILWRTWFQKRIERLRPRQKI
ncbi:MAG: transglutaminase domain-containing protein [Caldilineaceae bacterium]|nr:transglutaminase domain-containing protein [Caldilineaceae bacterium]